MPNYKEMYLTLFRATENAINCLISAQRACEEMYVGSEENDLSAPAPSELIESRRCL